MTKKEIVRRIATELGIDQVLTKRVVQRTLDMILETVAEEGRLELRNFGVFEVKVRAPRKARNPRTNEQVTVPAKTVVVFQPGKKLAELASRLDDPSGAPSSVGSASSEAPQPVPAGANPSGQRG